MPALDDFQDYRATINSPIEQAETIVPSDSTDLTRITRALNVANSGYVHVTTKTGTDVTLFLGAGTIFPVRVSRVWATGTTASGIVGLS
ncbi:MAG: hypothetical protein AB8B51_06290 [Sedimentitalea sp.]